jgi:acyl-CoA reductase-like NAD-dependent aldehyde dehydrogenase
MKTHLDINQETMLKLITACDEAFKKFRHVSRSTRSRLLQKMAEGIELRRADLIKVIVDEAGKPITLADAEVSRAISTFTIAAEEAKRYGGELIPLDVEASGRAYSSMTSAAISYFVPRGPVLAITPFNFPLNLVAHKIAPALAVGATVMLKPPPQAPGASNILAEIFQVAREQVSDARDQIPKDTFQVFTAANEVTAIAVKDTRLTILSFTGSNTVGWMLQSQAIRKKVSLELGGNAGVIIHKDADLERAVQRSVWGAFAYAGQICISIQHIFVHKDIASKFQERLVAETKKIGFGDPWKKETLMGPIIDERSFIRIQEWIHGATKAGAQILCGGKVVESANGFKHPRLIEPTILKNVPKDLPLSCDEAFGPIAILHEYEDFAKVIEEMNSSKFGLQAGIFTDSASLQQLAAQELEVGGIIFNDIPTFRADNMPYGGVKESGLGREGVRFTMEDFSERKTLVTWRG